ncbi:MAG TPA: hypothetical protein VGS41_03525, partial [Chthonomonadales bacterium]|nr:hypothetical protein [Chthonomonadales bacterium]
MRIESGVIYTLHDGWRNLIYLELSTDTGLKGYGEATLANRTEPVTAYLQALLDRVVVGADPFDTERLWNRIYSGDFIRNGMEACAAL